MTQLITALKTLIGGLALRTYWIFAPCGRTALADMNSRQLTRTRSLMGGVGVESVSGGIANENQIDQT